MTTKILVWLGDEFTYFGMSYFLQNQPCDLYGIFDTENKNIKHFFQTQNLVNFKQLWSYQENISLLNNEPDLDYLKSFEKKYDIDLWNIIFSERYFYPEFNVFYKFHRNELLSIIEKECKFFEKILDDVKPEYFLVTLISRHQKYLLYKMCKSLGIKILTWETARFRGKWMISKNLAQIDSPESFVNYDKGIIQNEGDLMKYLKRHQQPMSLYSEQKSLKSKKISSLLKFLNTNIDTNHENSYISYGKTKSKILSNSRRFKEKKRKEIESFMDEKFEKNPSFSTNFAYFPLHVEPERELLIESPLFSNQISIIQNIAKSLPIDYTLFVKEHPGMKNNGWHEKSFYQQILNIPNVIMIHPDIKSHDLIKHSKLVLNIAGDSSLESSFFGKPSIVFTKTDYSILSSVFFVDDLRNLNNIIKSALKTKVESLELQKYINFLDQNSFDFDYIKIRADFNNTIYYPGFLGEIQISDDLIQEFILSHKSEFELLANENTKKIQSL